MAYIDPRSRQHRAPILAAIGAIHAVVIYGLVTGLAGIIKPFDAPPRLAGEQIPLTPPEQIDPQVQPKPQADPIVREASSDTSGTTTTTIIDLNNQTQVAVDGRDNSGILPPTDLIKPAATPTPDPVSTATRATPIGKPGLWVTPNDYPAADLRAEHEGTTRFRLAIGADGKVQGCEITVSSGHPSLDAAACATLRKRARFVAATGASGAGTAGTYSGGVVWTIPKD